MDAAGERQAERQQAGRHQALEENTTELFALH